MKFIVFPARLFMLIKKLIISTLNFLVTIMINQSLNGRAECNEAGRFNDDYTRTPGEIFHFLYFISC